MQQTTFGAFSYEFAQRQLTRRGEPVALGQRGLLLLDCLLRRRGETIRKSDLIGAAWGDQIVEDSNLSVQIATLRRILGKDDAGRDWIATVERVGYRFLPPPVRTVRAGYLSLPTVEVGLVHDSDDGRLLAEAETDDLVAGLSRFSWLNARRSGDSALPPDYRVTGTIRASGSAGSIRLRLADGLSGRTIWADTIELASGANAVDPRHRMVATIEARVHAAEIRKSAIERPGSTAAYDLYLRGRAKIRSSKPAENAEATALYLKALELEPGNALFLAAVAEALHHRRAVGWEPLTDNDLRLGRDYARRGQEAAEYDAVSLCLIGNAMCTCGEPELGLELTELAAEMNPSSPLILGCAGHSQHWLGDLERARDYYARAIALDPRDPTQRFHYAGLSAAEYLTGEVETSLETARRGYALSPGYSSNYWRMMAANLELGRGDDARRVFTHYRDTHPGATVAGIRTGQPFADQRRIQPTIDALRELGLPES